jgi:asparagine synthase (glutamine-hydrolysing)
MSGIVGLVNFDGSGVELGLIQRLTDFLEFRGPDHRQIWVKDNVAFGHTLFKTTDEFERDCQPLTLDGQSWIVADARIDARDELAAALNCADEQQIARSEWTDAELILRAYRAWGESCVDHLLGDFAFGIWDGSRQQLFCARDHMGVKPFYYAQIGACVIFSNTLDCIRRHPLTSEKLNDLAIADFLLFGFNQEPATTSFTDIRRIPAAHSLTWSRGSSRMHRYWSLPVDEPAFYKNSDDYVARFDDLLSKAVADRLRTNRAWVFMSGGLDSPTLATKADELLRRQYAQFELQALTKTDSFLPEESRYADIAAQHLGIPILYRRWTEETTPEWEKMHFCSPEPCAYACMIPAEARFWGALKNHSRVFLYGEGPDNALHCDWAPYLLGLASDRNYIALLRSTFATLVSERRPPFYGKILRAINRSTRANDGTPSYPEWLNRNIESRFCLRERWSAARVGSNPIHPWRPRGYTSLHSPLWQATFEGFDMGATRSLYETRYPFVDIRLLRFLLSVPALPWCRSKRLLRVAMRNKLPSQILGRRKAAMDSFRLFKYLAGFCQLPLEPATSLRHYVNVERVAAAECENSTEDNLKVRGLNHWLQHSWPGPHNPQRSFCDPAM